MGLGRRKFLEYMAIAITGLTLDPFKAIAFNNDYYINKKFGFLLSKPATWDFVTAKEY
jgi:hypothetical protein